MDRDAIQMLIDGISAQGRQKRTESGQWTIREIVAALSNVPDDAPLVIDYYGTDVGWEDVGSYRGYYDELAIEHAAQDGNVRGLRQKLEAAVGTTYEGYKGGDYTMNGATPVWVSTYGHASQLAVVGIEFKDGTARLLTEPRNEF